VTEQTDTKIPSTQSLLEQISDLEEQLDNLKRLEAAGQRNVDLFKKVLTSSREGIALTRPDGTFICIVRSAFGYVSGNLAGTNFKSLIHPEDQATIEECYRRVLEGGETCVENKVRLRRGDGSVTWVEGSITNMLDEPAVGAIVLNYRDATARNDQEWAIRELSAVVESSPYAVFSTSPGGQVVTWHTSAERMFRATPKDAVGMPVLLMIPPDLHAEEDRYLAFVMEQGQATPPFRTRRLREDGTLIHVELVLSPITIDGQIRGVAHVARMLGE